MMGATMRVVILAGGRGTRLGEQSELIPKPMIEVGDRPLLSHLLDIYRRQGFGPFSLALGYKGYIIAGYFAETTDVECVATGEDTLTGPRIKVCAPTETFMLTYGDGLADIDLHALLAFHRGHGRLATVTAVHPPGRFGVMRLDGSAVVEFAEKPQSDEGWINGGFFVLEPEVLSRIGDEMFEHGPLEGLAHDGQLMAYRHEGFWQPMDTLRDKRLLDRLWEEGAPWSV